MDIVLTVNTAPMGPCEKCSDAGAIGRLMGRSTVIGMKTSWIALCAGCIEKTIQKVAEIENDARSSQAD